MKRDWMDYANLASSLGQNLQLSEIGSQLEKLKEQQETAASDAVRQEAMRNYLWDAYKLLEQFKAVPCNKSPRAGVNVLLLTQRLEALRNLKLPFTEKDFSSWEDKKRASDYFAELDSIKAGYENERTQYENELAPTELADVRKTAVAMRDFEHLNRFILLKEVSERYDADCHEIEGQVKMLKPQKKAAGSTELEEMEIKLEALKKSERFGPMPEIWKLNGAEKVAKDLKVDPSIMGKKRSELLSLCAEEFGLLKEKFSEHEDPKHYRQELLEAAQRFLGFDSADEAEKRIFKVESLETELAPIGDRRAKLVNTESEKISQQRAAAAKGAKSGNRASLIVCTLLLFPFAYGLVVNLLKASGMMEMDLDPSENMSRVVLFGLVVSALLVVIVKTGLSLARNRKK